LIFILICCAIALFYAQLGSGVKRCDIQFLLADCTKYSLASDFGKWIF